MSATAANPNAETAALRVRALASCGVLECAAVSRVFLFGSRARNAGACGDWDFLLEFSRAISPREYWFLKKCFAGVFPEGVDLASPQYPCSCDAVFFENISRDLIPIFPHA